MITYDDSKKDLPSDQLLHLFFCAGWTDSNNAPYPDLLKVFSVPFINST